MSARMIWYTALNGTRKVLNMDRMHKIPGSGDKLQILVTRHCGGLLAVRLLSSGGGVEITEPVLRERLAETGHKLPWEE